MERPSSLAPVPRFDRTMLRLSSAVQLVPFFVSQERNLGQCSPSRERPYRLSSTVPKPRHKSRAIAFHPYFGDVKQA
ncbi:MAG TPA: hypothetical protein VJ746_18250 [Nitrospira sp.]|nr:hypothetical protein [Nitrospira sp.]